MWDCAAQLCREFGIPALRWPRERNALPLRRLGNLALNAALTLATKQTGLLHNDHFLGFKRAGAYALPELLADVAQLRPGLTEITLHPSLADGDPYPSLHGQRERLMLLDDTLVEQLAAHNIELTTWGEATQ